MSTTFWLRLPVILLLALPWSVQATPLFESQAPLVLTLRGPVKELLRKRKSRQPFPFELEVGGSLIDVELSGRGKSRLKTCSFPPLRMEFPDDAAAPSLFQGLHRLKLVTHCHNREDNIQNLLEEFLAYRIFNLMTDASFRVRLLKVNWVDTSRNRTEPFPAFIIEPVEHLAGRLDGAEVEIPAVSIRTLNDLHEARVYVFQYLIGNTDWSLVAEKEEDACCHNGKLVSLPGGLHYLPYDFDASGLVNADYARPDPKLGINKVTQRRYRGFCLDRAPLLQAMEEASETRPEIETMLKSLDDMQPENAEDLLRFLDGFYRKASDPDPLLAEFEQACLGPSGRPVNSRKRD